MFYIVGLGNPGDKYINTRHNIGWLVLDYVCKEAGLPAAAPQKHLNGRATDGLIGGESASVLYPDTYMNNSGSAVAKFVPKIEYKNLIVIHDDIDLPFGSLKISQGGGDAGHNGLKSIISSLGTKDFIRIRIGIAPRSFWTGEVKRPKGGGPLEKYVLKPFTKKEEEQLKAVKERASGALQTTLKSGPDVAMNKFN